MQKFSNFSLLIIASIAVIDGIVKYYALQIPFKTNSEEIFDFILHKNFGIAFNIPVPLTTILALTCVILAITVQQSLRIHQPLSTIAAVMIIAGAMNNAIDRLIHGFTTDYILLFGRSVINLSDLLIITGAVLFTWYYQRTPRAVHYS